ncbi:hypothetical protein [Actinomadura sp. NPDC000600]
MFPPGLASPVFYLILLTSFGAALLVARITSGSLWSAWRPAEWAR